MLTAPSASIVAVHGLDGHREKTWTVNNVNWLRDFLPSDIPNAHILTWGYDANTHSIFAISGQYLYDHAKTLVSDLCLKRRLTKVRETCLENDCFVKEKPRPERVLSSSFAHSLGGIVVKSVGYQIGCKRRKC